MAKDLLLEIGTEEIPASFVPRALNSLEGILRKSFDSKKLAFSAIKTLGTPRRLTLIVEGLIEKQSDSVIEARGPQLRAAYDSSGNPTGALIGFAKSQGVAVKDVKTVKTDKGEYVSITKEIKGEETSKRLPEILAGAISQDFFPKSMRWGSYDISFARPVHSILAIYGADPVSFEFGHIKSSAQTFGHRFLTDSKAIRVDSVTSYVNGLKEAYVIVDPAERRKLIAEGVEKSAKAVGGRIIQDDSLLEEVSYLVEYPIVLRGNFGKEFLELPKDVVVNVMREHQRYFSIIDDKGNLLPYFITIANTLAKDMDVVRKGNERVLKARLNDAKFYFEQDISRKLVDRVEKLKGVVFQAKLGTSYEKIERFTELALFIGAKTGFSKPKEADEAASDYATKHFNPAAYDKTRVDPGLYAKFIVGRAAILAKADLTSGMVGEFPKLQGTMGSTYAQRDNEVPEVCVAIYEHYLPNISGGALPASVAGAIVSIADKLDTICGCFGVGLIPTGAQDPYALRRQSLGVIAIMLDKGFTVPIDELVDKALDLLSKKLTRPKGEVKADVLEFFKDRLKNQLLSQELSFDSIDAVLSAPWHDIVDAVKRIKALEGFKKDPACARLVVAFKRVSNILKGAEFGDNAPDASLLKEPQEKELYETWKKIAPVIEGNWKKGDYEAAFSTLASIKDTIDAFFDKVMVMAEDMNVRQNRLLLLGAVRGLYFRIADLSRLVV